MALRFLRLTVLLVAVVPSSAVFADGAERQLLDVQAAARFGVRVPPPKNCDFRIEISTDGGKSWRPLAQAEISEDNEFSSGWMYGQANIAASETGDALVRIQLYQGGYQTGLIDAQLYGVYRCLPPRDAIVTYGWSEAGQSKSHTEPIRAAAQEQQFKVPTGKNVVDEFVRIEVP